MREVLQEAVGRIPGALGAAIVGLDGLAVEKVGVHEEFNIDLASAEGIGVIKRATSTLQSDAPEAPEEVSIVWGSRLTILRSLGRDYYLCVVVGPEAFPGQARFETWRAGQQLKEEIR